MTDTPRPILSARQYAWITLAFVAFVVYGSLVPLQFRFVPLERAFEKYVRVFSKPVAVEQRSDWLANILLFIPLGFVAMGWQCVDRTKPNPLTIALILISCTILSAVLEFAQIYFPPRDTSLNDVVAETLGGAIGIIIWLGAGRRITDYIRQFWTTHNERNWALRLIPGYLVLLVLAHGMPFDLTLSPGLLKKKYHDGMVLPIPFTVPGSEPLDLVRKAIVNIAYFLPAGVLLAGLPRWFAQNRFAAARTLVLGIVLTVMIEFMQLLVLSRYCDSTDIITGTLAVFLGWRLMRAWRAAPNESAAPSFPWKAHAALFVAWAAALAFINWEPFDFSNRDWQGRLRDFNWLPFADYYAGNYLLSFNEIVQKTLLFVPFGLFLHSALGMRWGTAAVLISAVLFALVIELGQVFLPNHQTSVSDPLIEIFGAWLGCIAAKRLHVLTSNSLSNEVVSNRVHSSYH